jgi:hypothetical protein
VTPFEPIIRAASRIYFWPGATREDVEQEARFALLEADVPAGAFHFAKVVVHRHLIEQVRRETLRRPKFAAELEDVVATSADVVDIVEARERLRSIARVYLSELEREAVRRVVTGKGCSDKRFDNALQRARRKLRAAA